jgi:maltose alpha-D-glucosyltransferase/alpha-amylase
VYLGDRDGVRTPMQRTPERNAGVSSADPQRMYLPPIMDAVYGYDAVNVEAQSRDPSSQLNWMKHMLAVRRMSRAFGRGKLSFLRPGNRKILAYLRELDGEAILCVANLARTAQPVELDLKRFKGRVPVEMLGRTAFPPIGELPYMLALPAHGFYWFRLTADIEGPEWHKEFLVDEEKPVLVMFDSWNSLFRDKVVPWRIGMAEKLRQQLEGEVLPRYIEQQRWYAAKGQAIDAAPIEDYVVWDQWLVGLARVRDTLYFLPLAIAWEEKEDERVQALAATMVARVRQQANVGILAEAIPDERFARAAVRAICAGGEVATAHGRLRFKPTRHCGEYRAEEVDALVVSRLHAQSSNTSVRLTAAEGGDRLFLKCYRKVRQGLNPEAEVGLFLTEVAHFAHCVPLAGSIEYVPEAGGEPATLALLQGYVSNQGDGWAHTLGYLDRFLEDRRSVDAPPAEDVHGAYLTLAQTLATRTAELHRAFATPSGDPAFEPEPFTARDLQAWKERVKKEAEQTFASLKEPIEGASLKDVLARIDACAAPAGPTLKTRLHGDYHLGQVLLSNNDFVIIDFEGEPSRPLEESRRKHTPLRDVAGMLRSFDYAKWSALKRAVETDPGLQKLSHELETWEKQTREAFLTAYEQAGAASGLYASLADVRGLLDLAELEKVLYELRYEAANRPQWLHIPARGLCAILARR